MNAKSVSVMGVSHSYESSSNQSTRAIVDVTLEVKGGEFLVLIGPSGCGKTTLLNLVAGLFPPTHGQVLVGGKIVDSVAQSTGYMLARDALYPWRTSLENVKLGLEIRGVSPQESTERGLEALRLVGLSEFFNHRPAELSQGMRQRVALARTFATEPDLLLMDEPFGALDAQTKVILEQQLLDVWESRRPTVVLVTHDLEEAIVLADRVVICSARPCQIKEIIEVPFSRPRRVDELRFNGEAQALFKKLWAALKDEIHD